VSPQPSDPRPLVQFLYVLLRDYVTAGAVELIMAEHIEPGRGQMHVYSNAHLAEYAIELASRLSNPRRPISTGDGTSPDRLARPPDGLRPPG
jgi:hypothetical protein